MKRMSIAEQTLLQQIRQLQAECDSENEAIKRSKAMLCTKETIISGMQLEMDRLKKAREATSVARTPR